VNASPTSEVVAPERYREAGRLLPRKLRDEIARRFMAEFPGMSGAMAVRFAKAMLADVKDERDAERMCRMTRAELARFMEAVPLDIRKPHAKRWAGVGGSGSSWRVTS
jgi:hypothetical protein